MKTQTRLVLQLALTGLAMQTAAGRLSAQSQTFSTAGQATFTAPAGVLSLKVECVGGGGAGGRVTPSNPFDKDAGGGGGGGAYAAALVPVTSGAQYAVTVGAGGINNGSSTDGGDSFFDTGTYVLAKGGTTRSGNDNTAGVAGGQASASQGSVKYNGGNGGDGDEGDADGGGGGGAAGSTGNGYAGNGLLGGGNRTYYGGAGGAGGANGANGAPGQSYGGGGGGSSANGSSNRDGGTGASGIVVITWAHISSFSPSKLCNTGNATVTVYGSNLAGVDSVTVNGLLIPFSASGDTQLVLSLPAGTTTGPLVVNTAYGKVTHDSVLNVVSETLSVSTSGTQLTAAYSGGPSALYQWLDCVQNNAPLSGAVAPVLDAPYNGLFAVQVTENGCTLTSECFVVSTVGLSNSNSAVKPDVYPNPSQGLFNIQVGNNEQLRGARVLDISGKLLMQQNMTGTMQQLDLQSLKPGMYLLEIQTTGGQSLKRIVIAR